MFASLKPLEYNDPSGNAIHDLKYWTNVQLHLCRAVWAAKVRKNRDEKVRLSMVGMGASGDALDIQSQPECLTQCLQYGGALGMSMGPSGTTVVLIFRLPVRLRVRRTSLLTGRQESESRRWVLSPGQNPLALPTTLLPETLHPRGQEEVLEGDRDTKREYGVGGWWWKGQPICCLQPGLPRRTLAEHSEHYALWMTVIPAGCPKHSDVSVNLCAPFSKGLRVKVGRSQGWMFSP